MKCARDKSISAGTELDPAIRMLKPQQVFRQLQVSKNVGWKMIHEGIIPSVRLGPKTVRIPDDYVQMLGNGGQR